jgi:hypothetical protein
MSIGHASEKLSIAIGDIILNEEPRAVGNALALVRYYADTAANDSSLPAGLRETAAQALALLPVRNEDSTRGDAEQIGALGILFRNMSMENRAELRRVVWELYGRDTRRAR